MELTLSIHLAGTNGWNVTSCGHGHAVEHALDGLVQTSLPPDAPPPISLPLSGYAALLAAVDTWNAALLRARLHRMREWLPVLTPARLEQEFARGLAGADPSLVVTGAAAQQHIAVGAARGEMSAGITALLQAGLLVDVARGHGFSERGRPLAEDLVGRRGLTHASVGRAGATMFHGTARTWLAATDAASQVQLLPADMTTVRRALEPWLGTSPAPKTRRFCTECGTPLDKAFCTNCGARARS